MTHKGKFNRAQKHGIAREKASTCLMLDSSYTIDYTNSKGRRGPKKIKHTLGKYCRTMSLNGRPVITRPD